MKKILILLLTIFLLIESCENMKLQNNMYLSAKKRFKDSLTYFFPEKLSNNIYYSNYIYPEGSKDNNYAGIFITQHYLKKTNFYDKSNQFKTIAKQILTPHDKCNLLVGILGRKDYVNNYNDVMTSLSNDCDTLSLPIPRFNYKEDTLISMNDYSNTQIFVLSAKSGKFMQSEFLTDGKGLPDKWKNGYSNGIIANANKSEITYWLIVW